MFFHSAYPLPSLFPFHPLSLSIFPLFPLKLSSSLNKEVENSMLLENRLVSEIRNKPSEGFSEAKVREIAQDTVSQKLTLLVDSKSVHDKNQDEDLKEV